MTDSVSTDPKTLVERMRGWVAGFDRHEHVSTWVARELMAEAIEALTPHDMAALRERLLSKLSRIRGGLEALKEIAGER